MGWWIAALVLVGLAILPIRLRIAFAKGGASVTARIGPFPIRLYPRAEKQKPNGKEKTKTVPDGSPGGQHSSEEKLTDRLKRLYPVGKLALDFLNRLRKKIVVRNLRFHVVLAGGDPADLAVSYGKTWASLGNLMPQLHRLFDIRKQDVSVNCDFQGNKTQIDGSADLSITLARLLGLILCFGYRLIRYNLQLMKLKKGGAEA